MQKTKAGGCIVISMLEQKQIKLPQNIKIFFSVIGTERFLVFKNLLGTVSISLKIPFNVVINKRENILIFNNQLYCTKQKYQFGAFFTYTSNFILNFRIPAKKTIILRGLGLKANVDKNELKLKLGYSHESVLKIDKNSGNTFFIGKKFINIINYNKLILGNLAEKIYRLKKANCYKSRGLYYKHKKIRIKVVKKT